MGFMLDTTPDASGYYWETKAQMTPAQRAREAFRLSEELRLDTLAKVRSQNPGFLEDEVKLAYIRHICTDEEYHTLLPVIEERMNRDRLNASSGVTH
ncbi:MAG: hypothetical protein JNK74_26490 [Candidatus Hydrogenedentes bacterium]|nr:hypothetical protein [Candidatus Hydrogenedentota bacterium]